ncbi:VWA domain-containing protein [Porticoccus sp. W117]|uniref:VWA domain-containing protein n=1 Tax=Porticoccus sp. W117 TaxID=3054777 RepID=UPI0025983FF5|nr:VWA domain-containing protein [Porticoccus sp. W117]MDM3871088.1 VWA domain-containing protein [Porticoccus sp. W117]
MAEWQQLFNDFHWLRPWWLLALPLGALLLWLGRNRMALGDWSKVIDPRWLPLMLESGGESNSNQRARLWLWLLALTLASLALAGPTWQQLPQPLHRDQSALVVLLDLSPSMAAQDIKPDRITRARFKLQDILQQRNEGQTALVVYGGSAHLVTPLTDDSATIVSQLPVLTPQLISTPGSNTEAAFDLALKTLKNSGVSGGDLLLISDGVAASARRYIQQTLRGTGLRLSILGVGSEQGAPIPLGDGSFAKDSGGNIVMPKLSRQPLAQLAQSNGGQYSDLTADNRDLELLLAHIDNVTQSPLGQQREQLERTFDSWHDQGYWLALLLLPLALLAFRKGLVACLLLAPLLTLLPSTPAQADDNTSLPERLSRQLPDFLKTPDQRGQDAFRNQQYEQAAEQFRSPQWRGSAAYRQGDYQTALEAFQQDSSADGLYNQGNALAQLGELDKAIDAYNQALQKNPQHQDAAANKALVEQLKQQQQNQPQESDSHQDNESEKSESKDSETQDGESQQQDSEQSDSQQNNEDSDSSDSRSADSQDSESQNSESQNTDSQDKEQQQKSEQQTPDGEPEQQSDQQPAQDTSQQNSDEEAERAMEQFLRKVPDNPGAFLKEKFRRQQQRQQPQRQPERW